MRRHKVCDKQEKTENFFGTILYCERWLIGGNNGRKAETTCFDCMRVSKYYQRDATLRQFKPDK